MAETTGKAAAPSDGEMLEDFAMLRKAGMRVSVHAEDESMLQGRISRLRGRKRGDAMAHYESRPEIVEKEAVERVIVLARRAGCNLHVAHLSSATGAKEVQKAKLS